MAFQAIRSCRYCGVVDQPLPAHGGAGLFKIDTQHQVDSVLHFLGQRLQLLRILHGRLGVMDRAGANHHEQTVVLAVEDITDRLAALNHGLASIVGKRQLCLQRIGGDQHFL